MIASSLPKHKPLVTKIIHRNSIFSPKYNKEADSIAESAKTAIKNSISRFDYFANYDMQSYFANDNIEPELYNDDYDDLFAVNFSIGQPPIQQPASMELALPSYGFNASLAPVTVLIILLQHWTLQSH
ncbi:hypothetical protein PTKIN_Ptkin04bG0120400 [Pterospermum kingtungense]